MFTTFNSINKHDDLPNDKSTIDQLADTFGTATKKDNFGSEKKDIGKSGRKLVKKAKTESVTEDIAKLDGFVSEKKEAKRAKYNLRDRADESDAQSDSEPSEDNLEEDQICKLIPRKWGKKRFLKGVDEKKKKPK